MYSTRIPNRTLSILCERVGVAFDVGQDPYRIFQREAATQKFGYANHMRSIAAHVERGGSLADAIRAQGNYFPENFVHLIEVGERTGRLERVLDRLATYYKDLADLRAEFFSSILWPIIQLVLAVVVVGCMIYLPSVFAPDAGEQTDLLGIGLVGAAGLRTYLICVGICSASNGTMSCPSPLANCIARTYWHSKVMSVSLTTAGKSGNCASPESLIVAVCIVVFSLCVVHYQ